MNSEIDRLLHDADRKVMGANMARQMGDLTAAARMDAEAEALYREAMALDPEQSDPAWQETGNREPQWLSEHGLAVPCE